MTFTVEQARESAEAVARRLRVTERMAAARMRRWQERQRRQRRQMETQLLDRLGTAVAMPQIKMHITPWTYDAAGIKTRWVFQEGDYPL